MKIKIKDTESYKEMVEDFIQQAEHNKRATLSNKEKRDIARYVNQRLS